MCVSSEQPGQVWQSLRPLLPTARPSLPQHPPASLPHALLILLLPIPTDPQLYWLIPQLLSACSEVQSVLSGSVRRFSAENHVLVLVSPVLGRLQLPLTQSSPQMCSAKAAKAGNKLVLIFYSHLRTQPLTAVAVPTLERGAVSVLLPNKDLLAYAGCLKKALLIPGLFMNTQGLHRLIS